MQNIFNGEEIDDFFILNTSGGMIYNYNNLNTNEMMLFCSTIHSMYLMCEKINCFENVKKQTPKLYTLNTLSDKAVNKIIDDSPQEDDETFKIVFISSSKTISVFKTPTNLTFVFVSSHEIGLQLFNKVYDRYIKSSVLDPFYTIDQPIKQDVFN